MNQIWWTTVARLAPRGAVIGGARCGGLAANGAPERPGDDLGLDDGCREGSRWE